MEDASDNHAELKGMGAGMGTEVHVVNSDTHFSHKVWHETSLPADAGSPAGNAATYAVLRRPGQFSPD